MWGLLAVFTASLNGLVIRGFFYSGVPVELAFPLKGGTYYVLQGGDSAVTNPFHRAGRSQQFALDIVRLNGLGSRARRLVPAALADYEIFDEVIYSPCAGEVLRARDGRPDNPAGEIDRESPPGNHIMLRCRGVTVLIAHRRNGTVLPRTGERVDEGQPLGQVGKSGNASEPHLHVQAVRAAGSPFSLEGEAVPMLLDGRFLVSNSVIVR